VRESGILAQDVREDSMSQVETIRNTLKDLIVRSLRIDDLTPDQIADDQPLLEGELAIDSIDVLQLVLEIEKAFNVRLVTGKMDRAAWKNISTLAASIDEAVRARDAESR
jgi:acyl carrier protein